MAFNLNDYEMVEERIAKWWKDNPDGAIETELISDNSNYCVFIARIYRTHADLKPTATGWARTVYGTNKQTAEFGLELAETSAIGRALANFTYSGKKRASREEIQKTSLNNFERKLADKIPIEKPSDPWTIEQKEMPLPVADAVAAINDNVVPEEVPMCKQHNKPMMPRTGNKNGKAWKHYKCGGNWPDVCEEIIWMEIDKSGRWVKQKPRTPQGELN
jgi:hypothetical protein